VMMFEGAVFRVQYPFPNMESEAVPHEKKKKKKRMVVSIVGTLLSGSMSGSPAYSLKRKFHVVGRVVT
jgi:hypothetical protein